MRKSIILLFLLICGQLFGGSVVHASATMSTKTTVFMKANVPEDFNEKIAVMMMHEESQKVFELVLTHEDEYSNRIMVDNNLTYIISTTIPKGYITDIESPCEINSGEVDLYFSVSSSSYDKTENPIPEIAAKVDVYMRDYTELSSPEEIFKSYLESTSFLQEDENFASFLAVYSGSMFEKYYLNMNPMNTKEQWAQMQSMDKFNYYITCVMPYTKIMKYSYESELQFIEELAAQESMLKKISKGDEVYGAISNVWKWHYSYWNYTGMFYDFYDYIDGYYTVSEDKLSISGEKGIDITDDAERGIITEDGTEVVTMKKDNVVLFVLRNNFFSLTFIVILGIVLMGIKFYKSKMNIDE